MSLESVLQSWRIRKFSRNDWDLSKGYCSQQKEAYHYPILGQIVYMWTVNFLMFKLVLEKSEEPEIKVPTSAGSSKKQESSRKTKNQDLSSRSGCCCQGVLASRLAQHSLQGNVHTHTHTHTHTHIHAFPFLCQFRLNIMSSSWNLPFQPNLWGLF